MGNVESLKAYLHCCYMSIKGSVTSQASSSLIVMSISATTFVHLSSMKNALIILSLLMCTTGLFLPLDYIIS